MKTVKLTINGKEVEAAAGSSVFEAAMKAGVFVPHYCYHPDLSVAGVCRMCVVDIEKMPRPQISCNTPVAEGMVVRTDSDRVKGQVKSTLELHLINHPLDCPICDKAGECKLQDFYADYGLYESRMEYDQKVHKPKAKDIGTIMLDSERCILCTRCVRFTDEVTKTSELAIFNRGDRSELKTYDDGPLRNDYTGNLADICPVGALTAKDFRFQCRVWFLEKTESVCGMCARGCNTTISVNPQTQKLYRVEPRRNPEVNKSWICDTGRWNFHYVYSEDRVKTPMKKIGGEWKSVTWHQAFAELKEELGAKTLVGLSAQLTNEEIADSIKTLGLLGVRHFTWVVDESVVADRQPCDGILKHADLTANALGLERVLKHLQTPLLRHAEAEKKLGAGDFTQLFLIGLEGMSLPGAERLIKAAGASKVRMIAHASNHHPLLNDAQLLLPNTTAFEKSGSFVNALGFRQTVSAAIPPFQLSRHAHALVFGVERGEDRESVAGHRARDIAGELKLEGGAA